MEESVAAKIKKCFFKKGSPSKIPLMNGKKFFTARVELNGIYVDNLRTQPFIPWIVFSETIEFLKANGGQAKKGNAMNSKLGDPHLGLNTVEGHIASKVYGCKPGDPVLKRITPISCILAWAGLCENSRGQLSLLPETEEVQVFENEEAVSLNPEKKDKTDQNEAQNSQINILHLQLTSKDLELKKLESDFGSQTSKIKTMEEQLVSRDSKLQELQNLVSEKDKAFKSLELQIAERDEKLKEVSTQLNDKEEAIKAKEEAIAEEDTKLKEFSTRLNDKEEAIKAKEEVIAEKDTKLKEASTQLNDKEKTIKTFETKLEDTRAETKALTGKIQFLEKSLIKQHEETGLEEKLKAKEELIKQMNGTLASKEAEVSKLNEEIKKYKTQQKLATEGLKQIEEQKASKKHWWKFW